MKLLGGITSKTRYSIATVLLFIIITMFIVTRNMPATIANDYAQNEENTVPEKEIPLKLNTRIQSRIQTLALFIGYARSGHTLMGSLLDAHPHIIISNELDIFERWGEWTSDEKTRENLINKMYENSLQQTQGVGYRSATKKTGRTYAVPNQWQGSYKNYIKVIGDKKGGKTSKFLSKKKWGKLREEVLDEINLPLRLIHMVRNPFDNIATMTFRSLEISTDKAKATEKKINNTKAIDANIKLYLYQASNNYNLLKRYGSQVLTLHSEDVIANPRIPLKKLCEFLEVVCTEDYLNDCASIIYKNTSKTRTTIAWKDAQKQKVERVIQNMPFLRRYSFES